MPKPCLRLGFLAACLAGSAGASEAPELATISVTATRTEANSFDVPASVSSVPASQLRDAALGVNLADDIGFVPGLLARNRNNYAQDQQISIRGIGAESTFGIRGVRIYQDGIPCTTPDGQGEVSQFNLDSATRIEVLRGPFSALYGNAAGGVIELFTADGSAPVDAVARSAVGSYTTWRAGVDVSGADGPLSFNAAFTHFTIDGFRPHSDAQNESFNGKANYAVGERDRVAFVVNVISRPDAQDPLGLTPAQFSANPDQTAIAALAFNTRKSLSQEVGGVVWDHDLADNQSLRVMTYYAHRSVTQFLSTPVASQLAPTSAGGVVDLDTNYGGVDSRWTWTGELAGRHVSWIVGMNYDREDQPRRGYENFLGTILGVQGRLRRDETDVTYDVDEYSQASWDFAPRWSLLVGVRHSDVNFSVDDHYVTPVNGDDSGSATYEATTPVAGLLFEARPWLHLYASYGQGFQSPLGSELAYRPDGAPGLNFSLQPSRSDNGELGAKIEVGPGLRAGAAVFQTLTQNEIVIDTNAGGRTTYTNSGRTRRSGAEASVDDVLAPLWRLQFAYTYLDASYVDAYRTCAAVPCRVPTALVASGNRLPGVPRNDVYASLRWGAESGPYASASAQVVSAVTVNDVNTVSAPAYPVFGVAAGYSAGHPGTEWSAFVRVNNILNRRYVGSVIVDDANGRYFETAPPLDFLVGGTLRWK